MEKLHANIILEILGRPIENVDEGLKALVKKLSEEKGVKIMEETIHEPIPVKDSQNLFTSFAELRIEFESLENYFGILFAYMPSNIELIYPERINLRNDELNILSNRLLARLHNYDAIAKKMIVEKDLAIQKLKEVAPHLFKVQNTQQEKKLNQPVKESNKKSKLKIKSKKQK